MELVSSADRDFITSRIIRVIDQIDDAIQMDDLRLLEPQLRQMKRLALKINNQFLHQKRAPLQSLHSFLERMEDKLRRGRHLIRYRPQWPQQCFDCLLRKPKLSAQISEWNTNVNKLLKELQELQTELAELQTHLVAGTGIKHGEVVVERWLMEDPNVRIIGVCGGAAVGKTTLLQNVYNTYKVSDFFDVVIWVTVGQSGIPEVQDCIARTFNLDLGVHHSIYERKIKLVEHLKTKKFLLIFDNMSSPFDLNELGVEFGNGKGSKFICSSRMSQVIELMGAKNSICIQPLTREEAWELFRNVAFKDGHLPQGLEDIAREVADECKGSPLALNVTAATMRGHFSVNEWNLALRQMQTPMDHEFPSFALDFDEHLYRILRWGYDRLPDVNFKSCFMYCAMFPRDEEIEVDNLVGMWIAEGLIKSMDPTNLIDTAHSYLKVLVNRCFFQVTHIPHGRVFLKTPNTLLEVAIYIGRKEEQCLVFQDFTNFPVEDGNDWKRIAFYGNNIKYLTAQGLNCTKLVSLILRSNKELEFVPMSFLDCLPSIRVLDLSRTKLKTLPITLWQLTQLRYLDVSYTQIEYLSNYIGSLSELQFLNLSGCSQLKSLPKAIGHLSELQFLNALGCTKLTVIPSEIYEIKSLKFLQISQMTCNFKIQD